MHFFEAWHIRRCVSDYQIDPCVRNCNAKHASCTREREALHQELPDQTSSTRSNGRSDRELTTPACRTYE